MVSTFSKYPIPTNKIDLNASLEGFLQGVDGEEDFSTFAQGSFGASKQTDLAQDKCHQ